MPIAHLLQVIIDVQEHNWVQEQRIHCHGTYLLVGVNYDLLLLRLLLELCLVLVEGSGVSGAVNRVLCELLLDHSMVLFYVEACTIAPAVLAFWLVL
jgi:hypothetical protein